MKHIAAEQVTRRLKDENPWWIEPYEIPSLMAEWTPRPYLDLLFPLIIEKSINRAVVLMGPRRVGKTVLIHHTIRKLLADGVQPDRICYISIDHPIYNSQTIDDLLEIYFRAVKVDYKTEMCYFFLDEI